MCYVIVYLLTCQTPTIAFAIKINKITRGSTKAVNVSSCSSNRANTCAKNDKNNTFQQSIDIQPNEYLAEIFFFFIDEHFAYFQSYARYSSIKINALTNEIIAANNKILTKRSSNCSITNCQMVFPGVYKK